MNNIKRYTMVSCVLNGIASAFFIFALLSLILKGSLLGGLSGDCFEASSNAIEQSDGLTFLFGLFSGLGGIMLSVVLVIAGILCGISSMFFIIPLILSIVWLNQYKKGLIGYNPKKGNIIARLVINGLWTVPFILFAISDFSLALLPLLIVSILLCTSHILCLVEIKRCKEKLY